MEVIVKHDGDEENLMVVSGGFVEVLPNQVVILADTAEKAEEIDATRAEAARQKAAEALKTKLSSKKDMAMFTAQMEKELA